MQPSATPMAHLAYVVETQRSLSRVSLGDASVALDGYSLTVADLVSICRYGALATMERHAGLMFV